MKVLLLSAFKNELEKFIETIDLKEEKIYAKRKCFSFVKNNHTIYLAFTGIGTINAATTTTALCETLNPDCIVMCGTAGGLIANQKVGDIVVSNSVIDIDLYSLHEALIGTPYEPCLTDPHTGKSIEREFSPHPAFLELCSNSSLKNVTTGIIATSNTFPAPKEAFEQIKKMGCAAIEMESSGVFNAANHYDIPVIAIRAISNSLDEHGNDLGTELNAISICSSRLADYLTDLLSKISVSEFQIKKEYNNINNRDYTLHT